MTPPALTIESVHAGYGDLEIVRDVSLAVEAGRLCALIGRNGAGKTTLMSAVSGLVPLTAGRIHLEGRDITTLPAHARARAGLGLVQAGKRVFRELTVRENLTLGATAGTRSRSGIVQVVGDLCERFPLLGERQAERAGALSGGQQQLLAIAQALAGRPRVLMLDEPSSGLSPKAAAEVIEVVDAIKAEGLAVLLVEELSNDTYSRVADSVVMLDGGRVVYAGEPDHLSREAIMATLDLG